MDSPSQPQRKQPYVKPRVVQVERRIDGDSLADGCKGATSSGANGVCLQTSCNQIGS